MIRAACLLALGACWSGGSKEPVAPKPGSAPPPDGYEITMQRTLCMGMCPIYTIAIHRDGSVTYHGEKGVAVVGDQRGTARPDQLAALVTALHEVKFFDMDEHGRVVTPACAHAHKDGKRTTECDFQDEIICSDTPSAIITVVRGGATNKVTNEHCEASPLDAIEAKIDEAAGAKHWVYGE